MEKLRPSDLEIPQRYPKRRTQEIPERSQRSSKRTPQRAPERPYLGTLFGTPVVSKTYGFSLVLKEKLKPVIARTGSALEELIRNTA